METVYCFPAWDCEKGSLVYKSHGVLTFIAGWVLPVRPNLIRGQDCMHVLLLEVKRWHHHQMLCLLPYLVGAAALMCGP